jgi:RNA polymerase sigma factor for flagellar operon FliA
MALRRRHQPQTGAEGMFPRRAASRPQSEDGGSAMHPSADVSKLIETSLPYSHAIAAEVIRKLPPDLEKKDIQGWAELGLVEAANSFDPARGVQFKTFAYYRIRGAIYDGLRKMGWYPKGHYRQMRFEMAANEYLKDVSAGSPGTASPEAQLLNLKDLTANVATCYMLSLETVQQEPIDQSQISAEEAVVLAEQSRNLRRSLSQLPATNRQILEHCYFQGLTLEQIGRKLGLSKSWVCRLHAKSLEMLRNKLLHVAAPSAGASHATFTGTIR